MTKKQVLDKIKKKFGTYSRFARLAGIDRYDLQNEMITPHKVNASILNKYSRIADELDNTEAPQLTAQHIASMREALDNRGGVIEFCKKSEFAQNTVFQILSGAYYKRITPTVMKLMKSLNVKP